MPAPTPPVSRPAAPAAVAPERPQGHERGLVVIPYLGLNVPVGPGAQRYATGPRLGVLAGWHLRHADGPKSWSAQNGMLVNTLPPGGHGTDLVGDEKFKNFTARYEYMVPKGANSGFYLRGRHEIQILDDGDATQPSVGSNGALYNHTAPSALVSKKAGEWQTVEATIIGPKVTVILNGKKIIDNVTCEKPTGGELDNQVGEPGPIFLQGDHGAVAFRNVRIKPLP